MKIWQHVPLAKDVVLVVAALLRVVFFATSRDSVVVVMVLGMMSTRGNPDPPSRVKLAQPLAWSWSIVDGSVSAAVGAPRSFSQV